VTINRAESAITKAPSAISGLKFTGQAQALVNEGTVTGGKIYYAVITENTAPNGSAYTAAVPEKTDAGTYYVWYRVAGDANHKDIEPAFLAVSVDKAEYEGDKSCSITLTAGQENKDVSFVLPGTPEGSNYINSCTVSSDRVYLIEESISVSGNILTFSTVSSDEALISRIGIPVRGANYHDYEMIVTVQVKAEGDEPKDKGSSSSSEAKSEDSSSEKSGAGSSSETKSGDSSSEKSEAGSSSEPKSEGSSSEKSGADSSSETKSGDSSSKKDKDSSSSEQAHKVPPSRPTDTYAAENDNIAPVSQEGSIKKLQLDISGLQGSGVAPEELKMTVIKGTKLTTVQKLKDADSVQTTGGIKAKVNKKTMLLAITCKKSGSVSFVAENGTACTLAITVQTPKADKKVTGKITTGSGRTVLSVKDIFGTDINAGELTVVKEKVQGQAVVDGDRLIIDPVKPDKIKLRYKYLNKKYNATIKIR
jgi:hypothetical protein